MSTSILYNFLRMHQNGPVLENLQTSRTLPAPAPHDISTSENKDTPLITGEHSSSSYEFRDTFVQWINGAQLHLVVNIPPKWS